MTLIQSLIILAAFAFSVLALFRVYDSENKMDCKINEVQRVGDFEKVPFEEFYNAIQAEVQGEVPEDIVLDMYERIKLPERATVGSCGFDFVSPFYFALAPGETIKIPTGIRVCIKHGWWLAIVPRSSLGFKYRTQLDNTIAVIDEDYYFADNYGHIFIKLTNDSKTEKMLELNPGDRFAQGIFVPYGTACNAECVETTKTRTGGIGSTGRGA